MKDTHLVLITNHFPFGQGEAFLAHELPYLASTFDKVLIIAKNTDAEQTHMLPKNVVIERITTRSTLAQNLKTIFMCVNNLTAFSQLIQQEFANAKRRKKTGITGKAIHFIFKAFELKTTLGKLIKKQGLQENICLYSYWANSSALAITLLTFKKTICVCRAHGGDLYEYRQTDQYLPFRLALAERLTRIFPVSQNGERYFKSLIDARLHAKIEFAYLGSQEPAKNQSHSSTGFTLVSCSNLIELKRVHLIIEGLALITRPVTWIHFGDGLLKNELQQLAHQKLSTKNNITVDFRGFVPNSEILAFYTRNRVDAFINTSIYEGIPVSMMEAQSNGIPIIGTDVGAICEIVTPLTGRLLPQNPAPEEIATSIRELIELPQDSMAALRLSCKRYWTTHFNAADNLSTFASKLKSLLNEASI